MNKKERQLRQMAIRDTLDSFMKRLSALLEMESMRISCMNVLQFFEVSLLFDLFIFKYSGKQ
jgi:hypothetical protein